MLPVIVEAEACAEKLARYRRVALQREVYDLARFAGCSFDEALVRRLWVLEVRGDEVAPDPVCRRGPGILSKVRLLLAEDDPGLRNVLVRGLRETGYVVDVVANGDDALRYLRVYDYSIGILDWRMPGTDGLDVITWARRQGIHIPFLMLTARDAAPDRIQALDGGADDYLVKPFDYGELLARLRALLRRPSGERSPLLRCGSLSVDPATRDVLVEAAPVKLTPREFAIIELLIRKSPTVVHRNTIALQAWPEEADAVGSNTIEVHIARLRGKLARGDARIETLRGAGYRLVSP